MRVKLSASSAFGQGLHLTVAEKEGYVNGYHQDVYEIQCSQIAEARIIQDNMGYPCSISCDHYYQEKETFPFCALRGIWFIDRYRPGQAEACNHNSFKYLSHIDHLPALKRSPCFEVILVFMAVLYAFFNKNRMLFFW